MGLLRGSTVSSLLDYRSFDLRATGLEDRKVRGVAIQYERWQRVAESDQRAVAGSSRLREKIASGAVRIDELGNVRSLVNHRDESYLGSTKSGAMKLTNNNNRLEFEIVVPRTNLGDDVLAMVEAERNLPVSIGFKSRGKGSNIKVIDFSDEALEEAIQNPKQKPIDAEMVTPLDNTQIELQRGRLNGSDYIEGRNVKTGRWWRVYRSLDIREISLLLGLDPAWQGVFAQLGSGQPEVPADEEAFRCRARELEMLRLRC